MPRAAVEEHRLAETDHARVGPLEAGDAAQRRGLAAAAGSQQREERARLQGEGDLADAAASAVVPGA